MLGEPVGDRLLMFREFANYTALASTYNTQAARATGDAATTLCDERYAVWAALYSMFPELFKREYDDAHRRFGARGVPRMRHPAGEVFA